MAMYKIGPLKFNGAAVLVTLFFMAPLIDGVWWPIAGWVGLLSLGFVLSLLRVKEEVEEKSNPKLPSAEELSRTCTEPIWVSLNVERIRELQGRVADAIRADRRAVLEAAAEIADSHQDEPWGEYKNWRASQVTSREIRDKIRELKGAE